MGGKGLRGKGWLRKVGEKRYRVTEVGRQAAAQVGSKSQADSESRAALSRSTVALLERMLTSRALQKFRLREELTFGDLASFWNVSSRSNAYQLNVAVKEAELGLEAAEAFLKSSHIESFTLPGGSLQISRADMRSARALHDHFKEAFVVELDIIRNRADERLSR